MTQRLVPDVGEVVIEVDATTGNEAVPLPRGFAGGRLFTVRRVDFSPNGVVVVATGGDAIDGVADASKVIAGGMQVRFFAGNGGQWLSIGGTIPTPLSNPFERVAYTAYGHSYAAGATGSTSGSTWPTRLSSRLATSTVTNNAISATSLSQIATRVLATWSTPTRGFVTVIGILNSVQYLEGADTAAESVRAILATLSAAARYGATGTPLAYSGTWTPSGSAYRTTTAGDACYVYSPTDRLDLITQMSPAAGGVITATRSGDGAVVGAWDTNGYNPKTSPSPMVLSLLGLTPGSTVKFTLTSGTGFSVDGALVPNSVNPPAVTFLHEGPVNTFSADSAANTVEHNNGLLVTYGDACDAITGLYPNVAVGKALNNGWDADRHVTTLDGIHPNDLGQIFLTDLAQRASFAKFGNGRDGLNFVSNFPTITVAPPGYYVGTPTAPDAPTLSVSAIGTFAFLSARPGNTAGSPITGYEWRYRTTAGPGAWVASSTASANTTLSGLTSEVSYDFQAAETNAIGTSPWSATVVAAPGDALVYDVFDRADGALGDTTSGDTWTVATGHQIYSQEVGSSAANLDASFVDVGQADFTATATIATLGGGSPGLVFRYVDANHFLLLMPTSGVYTVYRRIASGANFSVVTTFTGSAAASGDVVAVTCAGTDVTVAVNGSTLGTFTDSISQTATKVGVRFYDTTSRIDNLIVTA
jgi:hypothetical protein